MSRMVRRELKIYICNYEMILRKQDIGILHISNLSICIFLHFIFAYKVFFKVCESWTTELGAFHIPGVRIYIWPELELPQDISMRNTSDPEFARTDHQRHPCAPRWWQLANMHMGNSKTAHSQL